MTSAAAASATPAKLSFLELFYEFARVETERRVHAAEELVRQLVEKQATSTEFDTSKGGFEGCFKELAYTLKRLMRGLLSGRDAARQGFALALHNVLACPALRDNVRADDLFQKVAETMNLPSTAKRQDIRESYFAKIAFFMAAHRSGVLYEPAVMAKHLDGVVKQLVTMAQQKPYLREVCLEQLAQVAARVPRAMLDGVVLMAVRTFFAEGHAVTAEALSFSLALREILGAEADAADAAGGGSSSDPDGDSGGGGTLSRAALACLRPHVLDCVDALKNSSAVFPRLHSVWARIFALPSVPEAAAAAVAAAARGQPAPVVTPVSDEALRHHETVWTQIVDRSILTSTHERQYIAFELFKALLVSPACVAAAAAVVVAAAAAATVRCCVCFLAACLRSCCCVRATVFALRCVLLQLLLKLLTLRCTAAVGAAAQREGSAVCCC